LSRLWLVVVIFIIGIIVVTGIYVISASQVKAAPEQPIYFNHEVMVQAGVTCDYCHAEARRSPAAGMPSVQKCVGCHQTINPQSPAIQQMMVYWQRQEPIPWVRVNVLPRFVYFSHQAHVTAAGISCSMCHGDVGHMTVAQPVMKMDMGWCLSCHEKQANAAQLTDCVVCHK
jgi:hypothetical protein